MVPQNLFQFLFIYIFVVFSKIPASKNKTHTVNVLVGVSPPFTYYSEINRGFHNGIDKCALETVASRLNLTLNLVKVDNFKQFSQDQLE